MAHVEPLDRDADIERQTKTPAATRIAAMTTIGQKSRAVRRLRRGSTGRAKSVSAARGDACSMRFSGRGRRRKSTSFD
jgi:hypothetical protein